MGVHRFPSSGERIRGSGEQIRPSVASTKTGVEGNAGAEYDHHAMQNEASRDHQTKGRAGASEQAKSCHASSVEKLVEENGMRFFVTE